MPTAWLPPSEPPRETFVAPDSPITGGCLLRTGLSRRLRSLGREIKRHIFLRGQAEGSSCRFLQSNFHHPCPNAEHMERVCVALFRRGAAVPGGRGCDRLPFASLVKNAPEPSGVSSMLACHTGSFLFSFPPHGERSIHHLK